MIPELFGEETRMGRFLWWSLRLVLNIVFGGIVLFLILNAMKGIPLDDIPEEQIQAIILETIRTGNSGLIFLASSLIYYYLSYNVDMPRARDGTGEGPVLLWHGLGVLNVLLLMFVGENIGMITIILQIASGFLWLSLIVMLGFMGSNDRRNSLYY